MRAGGPGADTGALAGDQGATILDEYASASEAMSLLKEQMRIGHHTLSTPYGYAGSLRTVPAL